MERGINHHSSFQKEFTVVSVGMCYEQDVYFLFSKRELYWIQLEIENPMNKERTFSNRVRHINNKRIR